MISEEALRTPSITNSQLWGSGANVSLWISCHGFEARSTRHLHLPRVSARRMISFGFGFPSTDEHPELADRLEHARDDLSRAGFELLVTNDGEYERIVKDALDQLSSSERPLVVADISSMNRTRIASLMLACASQKLPYGCDLEVVYFPSTFASHKHGYEPLETFSPSHDLIAGWPSDPDLPLALILGLGTEPRRAEGIVETVEPDILGLFEPVGDEEEYSADVHRENRRVLEVGGESTPYLVRDPELTFLALSASVERLAERARIIIVPLGPKIFAAIAVCVAVAFGAEIGVWKASAGAGVQPINVEGSDVPVVARFAFN